MHCSLIIYNFWVKPYAGRLLGQERNPLDHTDVRDDVLPGMLHRKSVNRTTCAPHLKLAAKSDGCGARGAGERDFLSPHELYLGEGRGRIEPDKTDPSAVTNIILFVCKNSTRESKLTLAPPFSAHQRHVDWSGFVQRCTLLTSP